MELDHKLRLKIDSRDGLIALAIIGFFAAVIWLGTVALSRGAGQGGVTGEVAIDVRAGKRFDQAQQSGVEPLRRGLNDRPGEGRPG